MTITLKGRPYSDMKIPDVGRTFTVRHQTAAVVLTLLAVSAPTLAQSPTPTRIISLVPALTEMLFAIGAGPQVAAVSSYDQEPAAVRSLPRVGALLDPDTERIFSLRPDLVLTYGSQAELEAQLSRAGIPLFSYRHAGLGDIPSTMVELGKRTGHEAAARARATEITATLDRVRAAVAGRPRVRTLLVFGREPGSLRQIYASGGRGFLHDMLETAGGQNVFADVPLEAVQASTELILSRGPEVIIEVHAATEEREPARSPAPWKRLASVPAVKNARVHLLTGRIYVVPGPRVAEGVLSLARTLHPGLEP